jgi:hypothetical protein
MVASNLRAVAPAAPILDCPLVPDGIDDLNTFLATAVAAIMTILDEIEDNQLDGAEAWVICNAWGVFDPSTEFPLGDYTNNPTHPLAEELTRASCLGVDVVFAASNCGQFCPHPRCGAEFRNPGQSIHGANSHPNVLTVGAVRADALWLGFSSQGPGQPALAHAKPDLCAPSQFVGPDEDVAGSTGTSASCAIAVGAVSALRSRWRQDQVSPDALRGILRGTAWQPDGIPGWNDRFGFGILDTRSAAAVLEQLFP